MVEVHIKALESLLRQSLDVTKLKTVDHWNGQAAAMQKNNPFLPAAYIDFGSIPWQPMVGDAFQTAKVTIEFHCVNYDYRDSRDKAPDDDGRRLKRFDWSQSIMDALNGGGGKDKRGNFIFNRLQLVGSKFDTNRSSLYDDVLTFTCQIWYFKWWYQMNWREVVLQGVTLINTNS